MSRVALLPTRGEPFVLLHFLWSYKNKWRDEVDKLVININSPVRDEIINFIKDYCSSDNKIILLFDDHFLDHGGSLTKMFLNSNEDIIIFLEEDSMILKQNFLNFHCSLIETNQFDGVGEIRGCCHPRLINKLEEKYGKWQWNFWPCFFIAKREDINKTDLNFKSKNWSINEYINELDYTVDVENCCGDTFVWFSIQMRNLGLIFFTLHHFDGGCIDLYNFSEKQGIFNSICDHLHHHSLNVYHLFNSQNENIFLKDKFKIIYKKPNVVDTYLEQLISWSLLYADLFYNETEPIGWYSDEYKKCLLKLIEIWKLNSNHIEELKFAYNTFFNIDNIKLIKENI